MESGDIVYDDDYDGDELLPKRIHDKHKGLPW